MEDKKRKGYKTQAQQTEANKRYLANNPEAREKKRISNYKSNGKNFIKNFATLEDLKELEELKKKKKKFLKNIWHTQGSMLSFKQQQKEACSW